MSAVAERLVVCDGCGLPISGRVRVRRENYHGPSCRSTALRRRRRVRSALLVDEAQAAGQINAKGANQHVRGSDKLPVPRQRIAEGQALARTGALTETELVARHGRAVPDLLRWLGDLEAAGWVEQSAAGYRLTRARDLDLGRSWWSAT